MQPYSEWERVEYTTLQRTMNQSGLCGQETSGKTGGCVPTKGISNGRYGFLTMSWIQGVYARGCREWRSFRFELRAIL